MQPNVGLTPISYVKGENGRPLEVEASDQNKRFRRSKKLLSALDRMRELRNIEKNRQKKNSSSPKSSYADDRRGEFSTEGREDLNEEYGRETAYDIREEQVFSKAIKMGEKETTSQGILNPSDPLSGKNVSNKKLEDSPRVEDARDQIREAVRDHIKKSSRRNQAYSSQRHEKSANSENAGMNVTGWTLPSAVHKNNTFLLDSSPSENRIINSSSPKTSPSKEGLGYKTTTSLGPSPSSEFGDDTSVLSREELLSSSSGSTTDSDSTGSSSSGYSSMVSRHKTRYHRSFSDRRRLATSLNSGNLPSKALPSPLAERASEFVSKIVKQLKLHQPFVSSTSGSNLSKDDTMKAISILESDEEDETDAENVNVESDDDSDKRNKTKLEKNEKIPAYNDKEEVLDLAPSSVEIKALQKNRDGHSDACDVSKLFSKDDRACGGLLSFLSTGLKPRDQGGEKGREEFLTLNEALIALEKDDWERVSTLCSSRDPRDCKRRAGNLRSNQEGAKSIPSEIKTGQKTMEGCQKKDNSEKTISNSQGLAGSDSGDEIKSIDLAVSSDSEERQQKQISTKNGEKPITSPVDDQSVVSLSYSAVTAEDAETNHEIPQGYRKTRKISMKPASPFSSGVEIQTISHSASAGSKSKLNDSAEETIEIRRTIVKKSQPVDFNSHQQELFAKIKEFQQRKAKSGARSVGSHTPKDEMESKTQTSGQHTTGIGPDKTQYPSPVLRSGVAQTTPKKSLPQLSASPPIAGKRVAKAYIEAISKNQGQPRFVQSQVVALSRKQSHSLEELESEQKADQPPKNRGESWDDSNVQEESSHAHSNVTQSKVLDYKEGPGACDKEGPGACEGISTDVARLSSVLDHKTTRLGKQNSSLNVPGRALVDSMSSATGSTNTVSQESSSCVMQKASSSTQSSRLVQLMLSQDSLPSTSPGNHEPSIDFDDLVSRIDGVVHRLIKSGKLEIKSTTKDEPGLEQRTLRNNTTELLKNLAILKGRRLHEESMIQRNPEARRRPSLGVSVGTCGSQSDFSSSAGGFVPCRTGPAPCPERQARSRTKSLSPSQRRLIVRSRARTESPISRKESNNITALRARRNQAALAIQKETQRLVSMSFDEREHQDAARKGLTEDPKKRQQEIDRLPRKTILFHPHSPNKRLVGDFGRQEVIISQGFTGNEDLGVLNHQLLHTQPLLLLDQRSLSKAKGPPKPENFGFRPAEKDENETHRVGRNGKEISSHLTGVPTSGVRIRQETEKEGTTVSTKSCLKSKCEDLLHVEEMRDCETTELRKLPIILDSPKNNHVGIGLNGHTSFDTASDDETDCFSDDDSERLGRIENMIQELRARRSKP